MRRQVDESSDPTDPVALQHDPDASQHDPDAPQQAPDMSEHDRLGPEDDLDGFETPMSRLKSHARGWLALVVALSLLVPFGAWAIDEFAFGSAGTEVERRLGEDAGLVDALLLVSSTDCAGRTSTGSAFVVDLDGTAVVVTNRHVVEGARSIGLRPLDGGPAIAVAAHRIATTADVAVLEPTEPLEVTPLPTGPSAVPGDEVRVVGFPSGRPAISAGPVAQAGPGRLLLDVRVGPGASGSPVLDTEGRVVGQVHARTADGGGVATPLAALRAAVAGAAPAQPCG